MTSPAPFRGVARLDVNGENRREIVGGTQDDTTGRPCAPDTRFQIASVSKQFTAGVVLRLADEGILTTEDGVSKWVPATPSEWEGMTIAHLLTHTAGLPHWRDIPQLNIREKVDPADEIRMFAETPLRSVPGTSWYYSSPGYVLLAHIAQNSTGSAYRELIDELIFSPLGMTSSFVGAAPDGMEIATGYFDGQPVQSVELDVAGMGAGDVWTTAEDLSLWNRALLTGSLLGDSTQASMFANHASIDVEQAALNKLRDDESMATTGYGYGCFIGTIRGKRMIFHPGDNFGYIALNVLIPDDRLSAFVMSNEETSRGMAFDMLVEMLEAE